MKDNISSSKSLDQELPINDQEDLVDYSDILQSLGVDYTPSSYYWQIGKIEKARGWIIHLSVIKRKMSALLNVVIPELLSAGLSFKIIQDDYAAGYILDGSFGSAQVGKLICIYPDDDRVALTIAKKMIGITQSFRGPGIPTDRWLGSIVYAWYGSYGSISPDEYTVPFTFPSDIPWPFHSITEPSPPKSPKLLNDKYYPISVLKADVKGDVIKALYFKHRLWIKPCIIKQGRQNMYVDESERDIRDRLKWQYDLHQQLSDSFPLPKIIDYFIQDGDTYLAMEFIPGISINKWIDGIYQRRHWLDLPTGKKMLLINCLEDIIRIIQRLHHKGFIHRDITPENFLIDKKRRITLIDMELAWSANSRMPSPPFRLGTPGFISNEQYLTQTPTKSEDAYAMGSLMLVFFSNLLPTKFNLNHPPSFRQSAEFFIGNAAIVDLICSLHDPEPKMRPSLVYLENHLQEFKEQLHTKPVSHPHTAIAIQEEQLRDIIESGIRALAHPNLLNAKQRWASNVETNGKVENPNLEMTVYPGWYTGLSGPLWFIAMAKHANIDISSCAVPYNQSWDYIDHKYFFDSVKPEYGLYSGAAGVAMALTAGLNSRLLKDDHTMMEKLRACFSQDDQRYDLAEGISGQGLALLTARDWLGKPEVNLILQNFLDKLASNRQANGNISLANGSAGIAWFLLAYRKAYADSTIDSILLRTLENLLKKVQGGKLHAFSTGKGLPGIALVLLKSYEFLHDPRYKNKACELLSSVTPRPVAVNLTLGTGLTGLGETYLEAYRILVDSNWKERADWIKALLINSGLKNAHQSHVYWLSNRYANTSADLFTGNTGILHFLLRNVSDSLQHPLWPVNSA